MAQRSVVWIKPDPAGAEFAEVELDGNGLSATGTAIGTSPEDYRLDYQLATGPSFVTSELIVRARGEGWSRYLRVHRQSGGEWLAETEIEGEANLPPPGGVMSKVTGALDCDLALSPLTNTMPVLRHGLLTGGGPIEFLMAWVSVPDLVVYPSRQRYTFVRQDGEVSTVRYESGSRDFVGEITIGSDGLVISYPGIGNRAWA